MEMSVANTSLLLLVIAAAIAMLTHKLRLPYSVGLIAAGMALSLSPVSPKITLTKELIYTALLPPLIFEAAFYLRWNQLRRELPLILTLATAGVVVSGAVTAAGMHFVAGWPWMAALVFGALIAATDPVSVIATFRDAHVHGRLRLLIESESLFNDGTAAVIFAVAVAFATGTTLTPSQAVIMLLTNVAGALVCGAVVGAVALFLAGRTDDHLVELTFTTVAAYGSFLLAERFGLSGVLATITAGLMIGNVGPLGVLSDRGREAVQAFWEYAAFVANSFVFLLIGMRETTESVASVWAPALIAVLFVTVGRAATVYPLCQIFSRSALAVSVPHQHAMFWGGLRGALALALALGLPQDVAQRDRIITISFAVVAYSIIIHGLTMPPLLRALGEIPSKHSEVQDRVQQHVPTNDPL